MVADLRNVLTDFLTVTNMISIHFICGFTQHLWHNLVPKFVDPEVDVFLLLKLLHLNILTLCCDKYGRVMEGILICQIQNWTLHFSICCSSRLLIIVENWLFSVFHRVVIEMSSALVDKAWWLICDSLLLWWVKLVFQVLLVTRNDEAALWILVIAINWKGIHVREEFYPLVLAIEFWRIHVYLSIWICSYLLSLRKLHEIIWKSCSLSFKCWHYFIFWRILFTGLMDLLVALIAKVRDVEFMFFS